MLRNLLTSYGSRVADIPPQNILQERISGCMLANQRIFAFTTKLASIAVML
jgi:hypothetical protein